MIRWVLPLLLLVSVPVMGSRLPPGQQQLIELLSGNTMKGSWAGRPYRQYFAPSGSTRYREGEGAVSTGKWRVNTRAQYCSIWPPSDRAVCYSVLVDGNKIYWKSGVELYPAEIIRGQVFDRSSE